MPKIPRKHLIIAGVPRAGKSTLARRVSKKFGYQHISMDSIIAGFEQCFPETGVDTNAPRSSEEILFTISRKMAPFLRAMMSTDEYDELNDPMVIDMYQLLPEDYERHIDKELADAKAEIDRNQQSLNDSRAAYRSQAAAFATHLCICWMLWRLHSYYVTVGSNQY